MGKKLLHTTGCDEEGHVIHVNEAERGSTYSCPLCGERIIARNEGKSQRPHFAHFKKTESGCNGENLLLHLFRQKAVELLSEHLHQKTAFPIRWSCPLCNRSYEKDLLQQVASLATGFPSTDIIRTLPYWTIKAIPSLPSSWFLERNSPRRHSTSTKKKASSSSKSNWRKMTGCEWKKSFPPPNLSPSAAMPNVIISSSTRTASTANTIRRSSSARNVAR